LQIEVIVAAGGNKRARMLLVVGIIGRGYQTRYGFTCNAILPLA